MRGGDWGAGTAWCPRRGGRGWRGRGECPPPPSPPADSSAAGSGSARTAHQTSQSSATIGILRTTTIQMKPQVMAQGYPGIVGTIHA